MLETVYNLLIRDGKRQVNQLDMRNEKGQHNNGSYKNKTSVNYIAKRQQILQATNTEIRQSALQVIEISEKLVTFKVKR